MKRIQPVILAVIKKGDKYLLTKRVEHGSHFNGLWQLPGGGLEFGESVEECVLRECVEELGLVLTSPRLIPKIFHRTANDVWHGLLIAFLIDMKDDQQIILNEEASEFGWFTIEETEKLSRFPFVLEFIKESLF